MCAASASFDKAPSPWRWPTILGLVGASIYFASSFVPHSKLQGASYPPVDFSLPVDIWLVPLAHSALQTILRVGALIVGRLSAWWSRVGWAVLAAFGAASTISAAAAVLGILNGLVPETPAFGAYMDIFGSVLVLVGGLLGLRAAGVAARSIGLGPRSGPDSQPGSGYPPGPGGPHGTGEPPGTGEPEPAPTPVRLPVAPPRPDLPPSARIAPRSTVQWGYGPRIRRSLLVGSCLALVVPLAFAPLTAHGRNGPPYSFIGLNADGSPVRWNPCQPVDYVENLSEAPPGIGGTVREAIRELHVATGITFVFQGLTSEMPTSNPLLRVSPTSDERPPVLIAWAESGVEGISLRGVLGVTVPAVDQLADGRQERVSGEVVLNAAVGLPNGFGSVVSWGPVVLHELGHLVGLGHVGSIHELMHPSPATQRHYGTGDLEGLRLLGASAGCLS